MASRTAVIGGVTLAVAVGLVGFTLLRGGTGDPPSVSGTAGPTVPGGGGSLSESYDTLSPATPTVEGTASFGSPEAPGNSQAPSGSSVVPVPTGSTEPVSKVKVPDVSGMSAEKAVSEIRKAGLPVGGLLLVDRDAGPYGLVAGTSPKGGSSTTQTTFINLEVPKPADKATMPNVTALTWEQTLALLDKAGIKVTGVAHVDKLIYNTELPTPKPVSSKDQGASATPTPTEAPTLPPMTVVPSGMVAGAWPVPGKKVKPGDEVTVTFLDGTKAAVPNVVGLDPTVAAFILMRAGFQPVMSKVPSGDVTVTSQSVKAGSKRQLGGNVDLTLGR